SPPARGRDRGRACAANHAPEQALPCPQQAPPPFAIPANAGMTEKKEKGFSRKDAKTPRGSALRRSRLVFIASHEDTKMVRGGPGGSASSCLRVIHFEKRLRRQALPPPRLRVSPFFHPQALHPCALCGLCAR